MAANATAVYWNVDGCNGECIYWVAGAGSIMKLTPK